MQSQYAFHYLGFRKSFSLCLRSVFAIALIPCVANAVDIPNSNFDINTASWVANGGATLVQRDIVYGGVSRKMGCFNNPTAYQPDGYYQGPAIQVTFAPLKGNTRYKFSFLAVSNNTTNGKPVEVRSTVREAYDSSNNYRARPYVEQMQSANGVQTFIFTTPLKDVRSNLSLKENGELLVSNSNIFFMAKPETPNTAGLGGELCVDDVKLEELTPSTDDPRKVTAIQVNQVGYGIGTDKKAILANAKIGSSWSLLENGQAVAGIGGTLTTEGTLDTDSGDKVQTADFSSVIGKTGSIYNIRLVSGNISILSAPFKIDTKQYSVLKTDALGFFYAQRSTQDINMLKYPRYHAWLLYDRPAGHNSDLAKCWKVGNEAWNQTTDGWGNSFWGGCTWPTDISVPGMDRLNGAGQLDVSGGWYDAADHGKYVVNGGVALWTLQNQIERLQKRATLNSAITDGALFYPNAPAWIATPGVVPTVKTDNLSDLLNEARYEMEWMLKMQVPGLTAAEAALQGKGTSASTWMTLPLGYQTGNDLDNAVVTAGSRQDTSSGVTWPIVKVTLTPTANQNVSGMAFHSIHDRYWTGIPQYAHMYNLFKPGTTNQVPAEDKRTLMYPTTAATLNLAATAAQCYRIWKGVDDTFANTCLNASVRAYAAAKANPKVFQIEFSDKRNLPLQAQFSGGGAYGDYRVKDEFYWAGIELYLAHTLKADTAATTYLNEAKSRITGFSEDGSTTAANGTYVKCEGETSAMNTAARSPYPIRCYNWNSGFDWQNTAALGTLSLATAQTVDATIQALAKSNILAAADTYLSARNSQGYLFPKAPTDQKTNLYGPLTDYPNDYKWGSNSAVLNRAIILGIAYDLSGTTTYLQGAADAMHYILGRNALGKSYVSGYGTNPLQNPHHRFWGKSGNVEYPSVQPGVMSGGPAAGEFTGMFIGGSNEGGDHFWFKTRETLGCKELDATGTAVMVIPQNTTLTSQMAAYAAGTIKVNRYNGQRCYSDDIRSFATNEVAVNWNAPLFWVTQFLDGTANAQ